MGVALARVPGGVDALLVEALDGLLRRLPRVRDRVVGVGDPEAQPVRRSRAGETTITSASPASISAASRRRSAETGSAVSTSSFMTWRLPVARRR